jgi:hypothetical protein
MKHGGDTGSSYRSFLELVRFEVLMTGTVKIIVLWDMMPYGVILFSLKMEAAISSKTLASNC